MSTFAPLLHFLILFLFSISYWVIFLWSVEGKFGLIWVQFRLHSFPILHFSFRRMKVNIALAGQPIPSEKLILKTFATLSACLILYLFFVTLFNSTCSVAFLPPYAACMRYNFEEAELSWHNYKLLVLIPFTFIIGANILFDFQDICHPIFDESPLKTSYISSLSIVIIICPGMFFRPLHIVIPIGILLVVFLIKGPLMAIWTNHRLKQKNLKKTQQKMNVQLESTLSAQEQYSQ